QVGNDVVSVGNIRGGQIIAVVPTSADYYEFSFGFGTGFIDKGHLEPVQGKQRVEDNLGDLHKPLSNQNMLTWRDTPVYDAPAVGSAPFGNLANSVSEPAISKLRERRNQTWFEVRRGKRLAWVSSLDAQEVGGTPML